GVLSGRVAGSLPRTEICLERCTEVWARGKVAMRTGEGMPDQGPRALRLSDARIELAKFGFRKGRPNAAPPAPGRQERTDLAKREPSALAELDQGHTLGARGAVVPSSARPRGW